MLQGGSLDVKGRVTERWLVGRCWLGPEPTVMIRATKPYSPFLRFSPLFNSRLQLLRFTTVALVRQRAIRPDVLLSDHNLPGPMNGIESINAVRAILGWHVPAIVMTGDVRSKTKEMTHSHGISYLTKPFRIDDLLTLIQNHRQGAATQEDDLLMREAD